MTLRFNNTDRLITSHERGHPMDATKTAVETLSGVRYHGGGTGHPSR